jgi:hypothetical protein
VTFVTPTDLSAQQQQQTHAHGGGDVVHAELIRQLQAEVKGLRESGKPEHARAIASVLRIAAAHGEATGLDTTWKNGLASYIRRYGRRDALNRPADRPQWEAEMRSFGETNPELPFVADKDRAAALDLVLAAGITPTLRSAAAAFDNTAVRLVERAARDGIVRVQAQDANCAELRRMYELLQWEMTVACAFSFIDGGIACTTLTGAAIGFYLSMWWQGC